MGLLILPGYLRKQPVSPPLMNQASVLGRQRWAMINIPGVTLSGSANPIATARSGSVYRYAKAGMSMVQTTNVAGGGFTFGTNAGLQLNTLSGVCVFSRDSAVSVPLFNTSYNGTSGGGFIIWCENSGRIEIDRHDISLLLQSSNSVLVHKPNSVAWSYNSSTGRIRIALNGTLTSGTATATLSHNTVATLGYFSTTSAANTNPASLSLLAVSPDECFNDRALIEASINPWEIFKNPAKELLFGAPASSSLSGSATGGATAAGSANLSAQVALAGVGVATAGGSAVGSVAVPLSAAGLSVAGGSAGITATVSISAAGLAQAAGTAGLSAAVLLAGAGAAQASGNATLAAQLAAMASGSAQAGGSANLSGGPPGAISASGGAVASGSAVLNVTVQLAATGAAQAGGSANLSGGSTTFALTAAGFAQAMGAGSLVVAVQLSASGSATAGGTAVLRIPGQQQPAFPTDPFYELEPQGFALPCAVGITAFPGILDTVDAMSFDVAAHSTHALRYQAGPAIPPNTMITVAGVNYKTISVPRRINRDELVASLVIQP